MSARSGRKIGRAMAKQELRNKAEQMKAGADPVRLAFDAAGLDAPWTPFQRVEQISVPGRGAVPVAQTAFGECWANGRYTVFVRRLWPVEPFGRVTHLSIKRNDRAPVRDWRDLQRIKNELLGPEREAVELYPRESRKLDASNQYHLWVMPEGFSFPFGQMYREVITPEQTAAHPDPQVRRAVQRPFEEDDPWNEPTGNVLDDPEDAAHRALLDGLSLDDFRSPGR